MSAGVVRSIAVAALTLSLWGLGQIVYIVAICPAHRAWVRAQTGTSAVVLDSGEGVARPGDAIFVCETPHHIGPILWHEDRCRYRRLWLVRSAWRALAGRHRSHC